MQSSKLGMKKGYDLPKKRMYSETSIKRTSFIKRALSGVPKLTSCISLYNEPLFSGHLIKRTLKLIEFGKFLLLKTSILKADIGLN